LIRKPYSKLAIFLGILAILFCRLQNQNWGVNDNYGLTAYDDFGYYLYLPAFFLHEDIALKDQTWITEVREKYRPSPYFYQAHRSKNGYVIQYSMGMAILLSPAFFTAHIYCLLGDTYPSDGFSMPYQISILGYSLLCIIAGLIFLRKFLLRLFPDKVTATLLVCLIFGTNFFHIALNNTSSPHAILFSLYCILLWLVAKWYETQRRKFFFLICIGFALLCLSRPNELLFGFIILLWGVKSHVDFQLRKQLLLKQKKLLIQGAFVILSIGSLQVFYWLYTSGNPIYDSYRQEDFKLLDPYLWEFLFSYKKGWLLYTPLMALSFIGIILAIRSRAHYALAVVIFMILNIWVLSSWDCWWYANSFSQRSMVQSYPIYLIPIGFLFQQISTKTNLLFQFVFGSFLLGLITLNLFQTWQQWNGILHTKRMTREYYWNIFGQTNYQEKWAKDLELKRGPVQELGLEVFDFKNVHFDDFESSSDLAPLPYPCENVAHNACLRLDAESPYSRKVSFSVAELSQDIDFYYTVKVNFKSQVPLEENPFTIVTQVKDHRSGKQYGWGDIHSEDASLTVSSDSLGWQSLSGTFVPPYPRSFEDSIHTFIWYRGSSEIWFDNLNINVAQNEPLGQETGTSFVWSRGEVNLLNDWVQGSRYGNYCGFEIVDSSSIYSTTLIRDDFQRLANKEISITGSVLNRKSKKASLVVSINRGSESPFYHQVSIPPKENWQKITDLFILPNSMSKNSDLRFYGMNQEDTLLIDYLKLDAGLSKD